MKVVLLLILYLIFKLSNEKTAFVPRDMVISTVFTVKPLGKYYHFGKYYAESPSLRVYK
jgi:hypothetical protein